MKTYYINLFEGESLLLQKNTEIYVWEKDSTCYSETDLEVTVIDDSLEKNKEYDAYLTTIGNLKY